MDKIFLNDHRGGSGAEITLITENTVRKSGNERVGEQGRWLQHNPAPGIVKVVGHVRDTTYVMERLDPRPMYTTASDYIMRVAALLALDVWRKPGQHLMLNTIAHRDRLQPLLGYLGTDVVQFTRMYHIIAWPNLIRVRTHGDPIIDNVMSRNNELVLIDPIPATQAIPDFIAVDVGRLLQSAVGYEAARYLDGPKPVDGSLDRIIEMAYSTLNHHTHKYEMLACYYFAVFHLLRACNDRRADDGIRSRLQPLITRVLKEAEQWM